MIGRAKSPWKHATVPPPERELVIVVCRVDGEWVRTLASFGGGVWRCSHTARELAVACWTRMPPIPSGLAVPSIKESSDA